LKIEKRQGERLARQNNSHWLKSWRQRSSTVSSTGGYDVWVKYTESKSKRHSA
jgi:hypothetical protein